MVKFIELKNKFNTHVILCNIGASIYDIKTIDKNNKLESILYTTKSQDEFLYDNSYFGKTIGRTGGRISNSKFVLNGIEYKIESDDPNGLHGGKDGLSFKEFNYNEFESLDSYSVVFSYLSDNLESGYPGNLLVEVEYKLYKNENKLIISYYGKSDKDTLLNLSNHAYFNLSGDAKDNIFDHELYINASQMEKIENLIPKEIVDCSKIYSFKKMHKVGLYLKEDEIINNTNGYDFPYIFDECDYNKVNVIVKEPISKRFLKIKTTYPTVVLYTCNYCGDEIMNNNKKAEPYYALCLECMYHPNTVNSDFLKSKKDILYKNKEYTEEIDLLFGVEE